MRCRNQSQLPRWRSAPLQLFGLVGCVVLLLAAGPTNAANNGAATDTGDDTGPHVLDDKDRHLRAKQAQQDRINAVDPLLRKAWLAYRDYHHRDRQKVERMFLEYLEANPDSPFAAQVYYSIGSMYSNNVNRRIGETLNREKRNKYFKLALAGYGERFSVRADAARSFLVGQLKRPLEERLEYYDWLVGFESYRGPDVIYSVQPIGEHVTYGQPPMMSPKEVAARAAALQRRLKIEITPVENMIHRLVRTPAELKQIAQRYPHRRIGQIAQQRLAQWEKKGCDVEPTTGCDARLNQAPAFEQLVVKIEPFEGWSQQTEHLRIEANGQCWYKVDGREAKTNIAARPGAVFDHQLSPDRMRKLDKLLKDTNWLTAKGATGRAIHSHPTTITLTLKWEGKVHSVVCHGQQPEPYAALLLALRGVARQERRIYLHDWVSGDAGKDAWLEIGREIAALRGESYPKSPFDIDHERYLPIAQRIIRSHYSRSDSDLIPALRLIGHFKMKSELEFLHRMAHDRAGRVREEVAWALGLMHDNESLPVLASMMSAPGNQNAAGPQLIRWGDEAVPHIVKLINMSTDDTREYRENLIGEDMIRTYLEHWDWQKPDHPVDPRVVQAVQQALDSKNPDHGGIRTDYHKEFLKGVNAGSTERER